MKPEGFTNSINKLKIMRNKLFLLSWFLILGSYISTAQTMYPKTHENDTSLPEWVQLMNQPNADPGAVQTAYDLYYQTHPFVKNTYTQYYKHWAMKISRDNNGSSFGLPEDDAKFNQQNYLQASIDLQNNRNASSQWNCIGPFAFDKDANGRSYACGAAHVYTIEQSATNDSILYAGTANAGVWKTIDKGFHWTLLTQNMMLGTVVALEIDNTNPDVIYFGGAGKVYKTTDGGLTWNATGDATFQATAFSVNDMLMNPANHLELWFTSTSGLYHTIDGGLNWTQLYNGIWQEIEFKPNDNSILYAIKQPGIKTEFYKSIDGGNTFTIRIPGFPNAVAPEEQKRTEISVTPAAPNIIYAFATGVANGGSGLYGIYVSHDAGESWTFNCCGSGPGGAPDTGTNKNLCAWDDHGGDDGGQYYYDLSLEVSPFDSNEVHVCAVNHWVSHNGGVTWVCPSKWSHSYKVNYIHADIHDCRFYGNDWWWACDGGIFYSKDGGDTINQRMYGIEGSDFWGFGMGEWDGDEVMVGGLYHNGTMIRDNNVYINDWISAMGGDNILGSVNPANDRLITEDYGKHVLPGDRTQQINYLPTNMLPNSSYWTGEEADYVYDPRCYNTIYLAGDSGIWKSNDGGTSFHLLHNFGNTKRVTSIEVSFSNPNYIYAAVYPGWFNNKKLYRTTDGGVNWTDITPANANFNNGNLWAPYDLAVCDTNPDIIYLARVMQSSTYSNLNGYKIFKSTNGGTSWANLTTPTLDGEYVVNIEYQRGSNGGIYLGTRRAVYYRNNNMSDWQLFNNNLPVSTFSNTLLIDYKEQRIVNATNRSIYRCGLYESFPPVAQISADKQISSCTRDTIYYVDHSAVSDSNVMWSWTFPGGNPSSSNLRRPKVVYSSVGSYDVTLTVTDAYGTSTQTIPNFITVTNNCGVDSIPGSALSLDGSGSYAAVPTLNLNSNHVTITGWIKADTAVHDWAGIIFCRGGSSTSGLSILHNGELRYHWNNTHWQFASGLFVPFNIWTHVALVITPDSARIYLNGIGSTQVVALNPEEFNATTLIGSDNYGGRFFDGLIDEVCFYNRSLSQNEIREQMYLTKKPSMDSSLVAYYQFNEPNGVATDKANHFHASFAGNATRVLSTGPFGGGSSYRMNVNSGGLKDFINTGVQMDFQSTGFYPNGDVVVSRINLNPDTLPSFVYNDARSYWIIRNYGVNNSFAPLNSIRFHNVGNVWAADAANPGTFKLYKRTANGDLNNWGSSIDDGDSAVANGDGDVIFSNNLFVTNFNQQFDFTSQSTSLQTKPVDTYNEPSVIVYPNPTSSGSAINFVCSLKENVVVTLTNENGEVISQTNFTGKGTLTTNNLPAGIYFYKLKGATYMKSGMVVVQ